MNGWVCVLGWVLGLAALYLLAYGLCCAASEGDKMICGHSKDSVVSSKDGTCYCAECEYEAKG